MRIAYLIIIILHGLIHITGFLKGFGIKEIKELSQPINKVTGLLWLISAITIFIYGLFYLVNNRFSWVLGFIAVVISQTLIISFWKDAKFGTIANAIILILSIVSFGSYKFREQIQQETMQILSMSKISTEEVITETEITYLPGPVQRWLQHSGVIGKPEILVGRVLQHAEMKLKPDQSNWIEATAVQYTTIDNPAFIWSVDLKVNSFLQFKGRDKFENGTGEMLIKLNSLVNVVREEGVKIDEGTIQRYLGEMVWFPTLARSPYITWKPLNDTSAIATMNYKGTRGSGTFYFNAGGDFTKFSAMRFKENKKDSKRYEWVLEVEDYQVFQGIKIPAKMVATWRLDEGDWTWLKLEIADLRFNENVVN